MASFAPLSQRTLPEAAVLPWRACNPAMDLVLVAGRLWRMVDASSSGSAKVWEHPGDKELPIEWAPDGLLLYHNNYFYILTGVMSNRKIFRSAQGLSSRCLFCPFWSVSGTTCAYVIQMLFTYNASMGSGTNTG